MNESSPDAAPIVLRPMSTGQILDRTFSLYRAHFWLFVGIASVPPAMMLLVELGAMAMRIGAGRVHRAAAMQLATVIVGAIILAGGVLAYLLGLAVAQGATVLALSEVQFGRVITVRDSYARLRGRFARIIRVILLVCIRMFAFALLLVLAIVLGVTAAGFLWRQLSPGRPDAAAVIAGGIVIVAAGVAILILYLAYYARFALAVPACVLEEVNARQAVKRSIFLARGGLLSILAIYLLMLILAFAVNGALVLPIQVFRFAMIAKGNVAIQTALDLINDLAGFVAGALVGPLATIALALLYYDKRVRKEAFDIHYLMQSIAQSPPAPDLANGATERT